MNELILANLDVLLKEAQTSKEDKDRYRARAYRNAIKAIKNSTAQIRSGKDALKLPGIGKKIADKIQEIIDTGQLHQVETLGPEQLDKAKVLGLFGRIWGVGPVKAKELWDAGARTLETIDPEMLTENQKIGLQYFHDLEQRVPRWEVEQLERKVAAVVRDLMHERGWEIKMRVCGSFRRRAETCGDMDILLSEATGQKILDELVDRLINEGILIETLGIGKSKFLGITKTGTGIAFRLDMEVIKPEEWPFALLYFTGSGSFNERQRLIAKKKGYSLSEHGLKDVVLGTLVPDLESERDIFHFLGMEYLAPWERT